MDWSTPYIVYRITADNKLEEVFWAQDIKQAKYWLTYIAKPGDVLCKTPLHPKHSHASRCPEYWSHKEASGQPCSNENAWKKMVEPKVTELVFPEEQIALPPND